MNYSEARPLIKSGDILAWTHKGFGSWYDIQVQAVRFFSRSEYTHTGIAFCVAERVFVLESVGVGIRMFPLSLELPFFWLPLPEWWDEDVATAAFSKFGQPYSKLEAMRSMFHRFVPGKNSTWECAEYVQWLLGLKHTIHVNSVPALIVEWCQQRGAPLYLVEGEKT